MDTISFTKHIQEGVNKLEIRALLIQSCLTNPELISVLFTQIETANKETASFAARILELTLKKDLKILAPHIDRFTALLATVSPDAVIRSCAKICELLCIRYFLKKDPFYIHILNDKKLEQITEAGFQWMITDQKIAVQAYTMQTLYLLGTKFDWIHEELALNLEKGIPTGSTGYKNRARKVIKAIRTNTPLKLQNQ